MATKRDYVNRLNRWADFLDDVDFKKKNGVFNIGVWALESNNGKPVCGTAACAAGWAAAIPSFRKAGFRLDDFNRPTYNGVINSEAVANFFGLVVDDAIMLIDGSYGHTRKTVAKNIRKLANKIATQ